MPTARAIRLCPSLAVLPGDFEYYSQLSKQVFKLLESFTPVFEAVSVDEGYLDMTGTEKLFGAPVDAAQKIRAGILAHTGLTASVGIASNRLVAKVATDACKPDNVLQVPAGAEAPFLAPFGVERLPGCGRVTQKFLADRGVKTIAQLQNYRLDVLEKHLGRFGTYLHHAAWGRGSTEFHEESKVRSISRERTFSEDEGDAEKLRQWLWSMAAELGATLRDEGDFARVLRLKLRYPPFHTVTRSRTLPAPTQLDSAIYEGALALLEDHWNPDAPLRLLGVGCVLGTGTRQYGLFEDHAAENRHEAIDNLKDALRKRFGGKALRTGRDIPK